MDRRSFLKVSAASLAAIGVEGTAADMFARTPSSRPEDLSVLFLGTGAADWNGRDDRGEHRRYSSIMVDRSILFDLTMGNIEMIPSYSRPETIFYTHSHGDHYSPAAALKAGVKKVYLSQTWYDIARMDFMKAVRETGAEMPEIIPLYVGQPVQVGDIAVTALPASHTTRNAFEQPLIYLIEKHGARVLYATDTAGIPAAAAKLAGFENHGSTENTLTGLIMEATMGMEHHIDYRIFGHSSVSDVERIAKVIEMTGRYTPSDGQPVYLTHLARTLHGTQAELDRSLPYPLKAAYDGLEVVFRPTPVFQCKT